MGAERLGAATSFDPNGRPRYCYRAIVALVWCASAAICATAVRVSLLEVEGDLDRIARERAVVLFRLVETTREWNARHGGVYVPVTAATQPNPWLTHPRRDVTTTDGVALTLVNPAFMTRQIAEIAAKGDGVRLHITSLRPIRPENGPDPWEAESLRRFEQEGLQERLEFFPGDGARLGPTHRYMAPLLVRESCLRCHEAQGYSVGEVRGGISITTPAEDIVLLRTERRSEAIALAFLALLVLGGAGHFVASRTRRHVTALQERNLEQEALIASRTSDLRGANEDLARKVVELEGAQAALEASRLATERERRIATAVFESASAAIAVTDDAGAVLRVNPAFCALTGFTPAEVIGRDPSLLEVEPADAATALERRRRLAQFGQWEGELPLRRKDGGSFVAELSMTTVQGDAGGARRVFTFTDVTRRKEADRIVQHRASHDALTDLPNRGLFSDRLAQALAAARRQGRQVAVLFVDLDRFKGVNDGLGHAAGDALLIEAARRMEACVRESDTVARFGGDEFALVLGPIGGVSEAEEVARRLCEALARPFALEGGEGLVGGSVGIALSPVDGEHEAALLAAADRGLYAAKQAGRGTWRRA